MEEPSKYVLVKLYKDQGRNRNLFRYLKNHCFDIVTAKTSENMITQLFADMMEDNSETNKVEGIKATVNITSQTLLEQWANETFSKNSNEWKLLLDDHLNDDTELQETINNSCSSIDNSPEKSDSLMTTTKRTRSLSNTSAIISSGTNSEQLDDEVNITKKIKIEEKKNNADSLSEDSSDEGGPSLLHSNKKKNSGYQLCKLCDQTIEVGKTRKTKIRRQVEHVMTAHHNENTPGYNRYQCDACFRLLGIHISPCEHIKECHSIDKSEANFKDLWTTRSVRSFNNQLLQCFDRMLPVPRGKRVHVGSQEESYERKPYLIHSEEGTIVIESVTEKRLAGNDEMEFNNPNSSSD